MAQLLGRQINSQGDWSPNINFSSEDWLEAVALHSPAQLSVGRKRSSAVLTGYIPFDRLREAIKFIFGFSWVDGAGYLRRSPPITHPWLSGLFATELIECTGLQFTAKVGPPHKWAMPYADYRLCKVSVLFGQPPYEILADGDLVGLGNDYAAYRGEEMRRHCFWSPKAYVDQLELPGGMVVFKAPGVTINGLDLNNTQIATPRNVFRAEKVRRKLTWMNVPLEFISNNFGFFTKLDKTIGKINSAPFFAESTTPPGEPCGPYTWLLEDVDTVNNEVYADPIVSAVFEGMTRRVDIVMTFCHFCPPRGLPSDSAAGWRLAIAADGLWYPLKYKTTGADFDYPRLADFNRLFTHWTDIEP